MIAKPALLAIGDSKTFQDLATLLQKYSIKLFLHNPMSIQALAWQKTNNLDWASINKIIVTSPKAIPHGFLPILPKLKKTTELFAIGATTAQSLQHYWPKVYYPANFNSESLLALPELQNIAKQSLVIFKGEGGRALLAKTLQQRQAIVYTIDCYQRHPKQDNLTEQVKIWQNSQIEACIISSAAYFTALLNQLTQDEQDWLKQRIFITTSDRLKTLLQSHGINNIYVAANFTAADLLATILKRHRKPL